MEREFHQKMKDYKKYFGSDDQTMNESGDSPLIEINLRTLVENIEALTPPERRKLFDLHNEAVHDEVYGKQLMEYCDDLFKKAKMRKETKKLIYILSIDWPLQFKL